jgi:antitoxin component YwqK of YwqJK toxin-antitoxin module
MIPQNLKNSLLFIALAFFVSCTKVSEMDSGTLTLTDYYPDGSVQAVYQTTADTIMHGKAELFYPSKKVRARLYFVMGKQEGPVTEFYENGVIKVESTYKNGHANGKVREYYPSGNLKSEGTLFLDQALGRHISYADSKTKKIIKIQDFLIVEQESYLNYFVSYDSMGVILNESTKLQIEDAKDFITIRVLNKDLANLRAIIGNYDKFFYSRNFLLPDTVRSKDGFQIAVSKKFAHQDTIRGRVQCFENISDSTERIKTIWFEYPSSY